MTLTYRYDLDLPVFSCPFQQPPHSCRELGFSTWLLSTPTEQSLSSGRPWTSFSPKIELIINLGKALSNLSSSNFNLHVWLWLLHITRTNSWQVSAAAYRNNQTFDMKNLLYSCSVSYPCHLAFTLKFNETLFRQTGWFQYLPANFVVKGEGQVCYNVHQLNLHLCSVCFKVCDCSSFARKILYTWLFSLGKISRLNHQDVMFGCI